MVQYQPVSSVITSVSAYSANIHAKLPYLYHPYKYEYHRDSYTYCVYAFTSACVHSCKSSPDSEEETSNGTTSFILNTEVLTAGGMRVSFTNTDESILPTSPPHSLALRPVIVNPIYLQLWILTWDCGGAREKG